MDNSLTSTRLMKLNEFKNSLRQLNDQILSLLMDLKWDYQKLLDDNSSNMTICAVNSQHRIPKRSAKSHEERCSWHKEGYRDDDKPFSDFCGYGSVIKLTSESLKSITSGIPSSLNNTTERLIPQTSANLDQNFNREEKLAIYNYVIANTQKKESFSDVWLQIGEKKKEKREVASWEIAAAERDAKRRRASYRNKVHTNRKTHTEILREVIEGQMEALKEEQKFEAKPNKNDTDKIKDKRDRNKNEEKSDRNKNEDRSGRYRHSEEKKYSERDSSKRRDKESRHKHYDRERHSKHKNHSRNRSPSVSGSDSRSRSRDKYRKWKTLEGRSHSHKSSKHYSAKQE